MYFIILRLVLPLTKLESFTQSKAHNPYFESRTACKTFGLFEFIIQL